MTSRTLFLCLLATAALLLGGCTTVTTATTPGTIEENYGERSAGARVEDNNIEQKISHNLRRTDARLGDARINVDSYNGIVLLTGQVPSEELKQKASELSLIHI